MQLYFGDKLLYKGPYTYCNVAFYRAMCHLHDLNDQRLHVAVSAQLPEHATALLVVGDPYHIYDVNVVNLISFHCLKMLPLEI